MRDRREIDPWNGGEFGFIQGVEVSGGRTLYFSGVAAGAADGESPGDIKAQVHAALDSLDRILTQSGVGWADVVRLNWFVKGAVMDAFWEDAFPSFRDRLATVGCRAAGTLLGVERLAQPEALCEFEATVVA